MIRLRSPDEFDDADRADAVLMQAVENQIRSNSPPETTLALARPAAEGESRQDAVRLIAACLSVEVLDALENRSPYNENNPA